MKQGVQFNTQEIQSGLNRISNAECLILQLPKTHDGRNTWLLNYGTGFEAQSLRSNRGIAFDWGTMSAEIIKG